MTTTTAEIEAAARRARGEFTEAEYAADAAAVFAHVTRTGRAVVRRPDGSPRVVISVPRARLDSDDDAFRRALIADAPLATVEDAIRLIEHLVDMTDPHDRIGVALTMIVEALRIRG